MPRFVAVRCALALAQCAVVLIAAFGLTALLPGDAATVVLGEDATPDQVAVVRAQLGLDRPLGERFLGWAHGLLHGDLGTSLVTGVAVRTEIAERWATTALLGGLALAVVVPLALLLGVTAGLREGSRADRALNAAAITVHAVPEFVLGLLLVACVAVYAGLLPATAAGMDATALAGQPAVLVLPVTVLVSRQLCDLARQVRIGVADQSTSAVATHLRLLGLPERTVLWRHVLPGTLGPVTQQLARCVEALLGGTVVVESLFAISGLGTGFVEAVQNRDIPAVQGYVPVFAGVAVVANLLADIVAYRWTPHREVAL